MINNILSQFATANIKAEDYQTNYAQSINQPEIFWAEQAKRFLNWRTNFTQIKQADFSKSPINIRWFADGALNVAENCIDRHLAEKANQPAIIWVGDNPQEKSQIITYAQLHKEVCKTANMLKKLGVKTGDTVTIYMPMIPQTAYAMLACARIGAIHSVVFGGFSAQSIKGRIEDCKSRIVITADEGWRGGKIIPLKTNIDAACEDGLVEKVLVFQRTGNPVNWVDGRDVWWHELAENISDDCEAEAFPAENPLFVLYTSGSTGKPKGILHSSAGYLLQAAMSFYYVFDYKAGDVFWCTADVGWITGHSYTLYGPLACGATSLMFEGVPTYPDAARFWQIIDQHKVASFYTAPTALRMLMQAGDEFLQTTSRDSLRVLGSVGEPINPEVWRWYNEQVGKKNCAIVDTWWQTETGAHLITPLPGAIPTKPGCATLPFFGVQPVLISPEGKIIEGEGEGALCIAASWPSQARSIYGDHQRYEETYFHPYKGYYFSGDAARRDADGYYWILGRMDDVLNVSGHRLGTAEIESALVAHELVSEAAVVGYPHDIKGEDIYAYVTLHNNVIASEALRKELTQWVRKEIGPLAQPGIIHFSAALPKTRSGKIMRRILRKIAAGEITSTEDFHKLGDITTLLNPESVEELVLGRMNGGK